jgi:hypothetical protein
VAGLRKQHDAWLIFDGSLAVVSSVMYWLAVRLLLVMIANE